MYIDYKYYRNDYGGSLSESEFNSCEPEAEALVNFFTSRNGDIFLDKRPKVVAALQRALCKATDTAAAHKAEEASGAAGIKSESNDGYSVSLVVDRSDGETSEDVLIRKVYSAIRIYLLPTGYLYSGLGAVRC